MADSLDLEIKLLTSYALVKLVLLNKLVITVSLHTPID